MTMPDLPVSDYDIWQCAWCRAMGQRTYCELAPSPAWQVGEHVTLWCPECERRRQDRYVGSPHVLRSKPPYLVAR